MIVARTRARTLARLPHAAPRADHLAVVDRALDDAMLRWSAVAAVRAWLAATGTAAALVVVGGPRFAAVLVAAVAGPPAVVLGRRQRRNERATEQLAPLLDSLASAVRAGTPLAAALRQASSRVAPPLRHDLIGVVDRHGRGVRLGEALAGWDPPSSDGRFARDVLVLVADLGGEPARALARAAVLTRERADLRRERQAFAGQARSSALVMAVAPLVLVAIGSVTDARTLGFLLGTPIGLACLAVGVGLDLLGLWWMARMIGAGE